MRPARFKVKTIFTNANWYAHIVSSYKDTTIFVKRVCPQDYRLQDFKKSIYLPVIINGVHIILKNGGQDEYWESARSFCIHYN